MVSMVTSRVRGAASLGVVAWLVSVSYVTGAEREELHGEEGQQESQEQLELQGRYTFITYLINENMSNDSFLLCTEFVVNLILQPKQ